MRINHNIAALNTYRQLNSNGTQTQKALEKLSSGLRINRAGDDAAGLAISEKMRGQIRGLEQASRNSQDAISLIQTAEGALNETHSILQRMRELANQAANSTNADIDRKEIQNEINQLTSEINRIGNTTEFNTKSLLNGSIAITDGEGKVIDPGSEYGIGMGDLKIGTDSELDVGNYLIEAINTADVLGKDVDLNKILGGQIGISGASTNVKGAGEAYGEVTTDLAEGSYRVAITEEQAQVIENLGGDSEYLDSISIHSNSGLSGTDYTLEIDMNTVKDVNQINNGGIGKIAVADTAAGSYTITTSANLDSIAAATNTALYDTDDSGAISNIEIADDSTLQSGDGLKISVNQVTAVDDSYTTAYLEEQGMIFEALDGDLAGSDFSITFAEPTGYQADTTVSVSGNDITVTLATDDGDAATGTMTSNDLKFTAKAAGEAGDDITINLVTAGSAGDVSVTDGNTINVVVDGSTTYQNVINAIQGNTDANNLVSVEYTGSSDISTATVTAESINLTGGGDNAVVNATRQEVVDALMDSAAAGIIKASVDTGGSTVVNALTQTNFEDGAGEPETTFEFILSDDNEFYGSVTASFSESSGTQVINLGDISFTVDNQAMFNGDTTFDSQEIAINTINNLVRVTDSYGNYAETTIADNTDEATVTFDNTNGSIQWYDSDDNALANDFNTISIDIDTNSIGNGGFIRGNQYNINVTSTDEYTVQMQDNGTDIGNTYQFTDIDFTNSSTFKHIDLGEGVFVDLNREQFESLVDGGTASVSFEVDTNTTYTAQTQDAAGNAVGDKFTLDATDNAGSINLGDNVIFEYDGTQLAEGNHHFSVGQFTVTVEEPEDDQFVLTLTNTETGEQVGQAEINMDNFNNLGSVQDTMKVDFGGDTELSINVSNFLEEGQQTTFTIGYDAGNNSLAMQIGANHGQSMSIDVNDMRAAAIGVSGSEGKEGATVKAKSGAEASFTTTKSVTDGTNSEGEEYALDVSDHEKASAAVDVINDAIEKVSSERSKLGSFQNRLEHTINNLGTSAENLTAAESRIRDVDMAKEMVEFTKNNILSQAAQSMLAQANQQPQQVLQLLR